MAAKFAPYALRGRSPFRRLGSYGAAPLGLGVAGDGPARIQQQTAWDSFSGVAGAALSARKSDSGHTWTKHPAWTGTVLTNGLTGTLYGKVGAGSIAIYVLGTEAVGDQTVTADIFCGAVGFASQQIGIAARYSPVADTGYLLYYTPASCAFTLTRRVAGSSTTLGGDATDGTSPSNVRATTVQPGQYLKLRLECQGNVLRVYVNNELRITVTDASPIASGQPGLYQFAGAGSATITTAAVYTGFSFSPTGKGNPTAAGATLPSSENVFPGGFGTPSGIATGCGAVRTNGATIFAGAVGATGPLRYQWYRSLSPNANPSRLTLLVGQNGPTLDDRTASPGVAYFYRLAVADGYGSVDLSSDYAVTTRAAGTKSVVCFGNSLTWGTPLAYATTSYPAGLETALGAPWIVHNFGFPSVFTYQLQGPGYFGRLLSPAYDANYLKNVCVVWELTNHNNNVNNATLVYDTYVALCQAVRALGYKVVACTMIDRQQAGLSAWWGANRTTINANVVANWATFADVLCDLAASANLSDATNATYFQTDKVHLTPAGNTVVQGLVDTAVLAA